MIFAKWGGSLVTNKGAASRPRFRVAVARRLASELKTSLPASEPCLLVHGAGSFGHPLALHHGIGQRRIPRTEASRIWDEIHGQVLELQRRLTAELAKARLSVEAISAADAWRGARRQLDPAPFGASLRGHDVVVTGGDIVPDARRGLRILSGDEILYQLARTLRPRRAVYATDVDGVLVHGRLLLDLPPAALRRILPQIGRGPDATGGMRGKLEWAARLQAIGVETWIVNGARPGRFAKALEGQPGWTGTRLPPGPRRRA